jgi:hypothetical protein
MRKRGGAEGLALGVLEVKALTPTDHMSPVGMHTTSVQVKVNMGYGSHS